MPTAPALPLFYSTATSALHIPTWSSYMTYARFHPHFNHNKKKIKKIKKLKKKIKKIKKINTWTVHSMDGEEGHVRRANTHAHTHTLSLSHTYTNMRRKESPLHLLSVHPLIKEHSFLDGPALACQQIALIGPSCLSNCRYAGYDLHSNTIVLKSTNYMRGKQ